MRDPAAPPRLTPRRLVRILILAFVGLAIAAGFGTWRFVANARATIAAHRARLPAQRAELARAAKGRPALLEPHVEGESGAVIKAYLDEVEAVPPAKRAAVSLPRVATPPSAAPDWRSLWSWEIHRAGALDEWDDVVDAMAAAAARAPEADEAAWIRRFSRGDPLLGCVLELAWRAGRGASLLPRDLEEVRAMVEARRPAPAPR